MGNPICWSQNQQNVCSLWMWWVRRCGLHCRARLNLFQRVLVNSKWLWQVWKGKWAKNGKRWRANDQRNSMGMESSITYAIALATRRTLGPRQTSVSLLSLFSGGSNQTNQTWVTLQDENKCTHTKNIKIQQQFSNSDFKTAYMSDKGTTMTAFFNKNQKHMGGCEGWRFITIQIFTHCNCCSPATITKKCFCKCGRDQGQFSPQGGWLWKRLALTSPNDLTALKNAHHATLCLYCVLLNCSLSSHHVSVWEAI